MVTHTLVCKVLGAVFLLVGLLGFLGNPIVGDSTDAIFSSNMAHNVVHLLAGVVALVAGFKGPESMARMYLIVFGAVYALVAVLGFADIVVTDLLMTNAADNILHIALAVVMLGVGFGMKAPTGMGSKPTT